MQNSYRQRWDCLAPLYCQVTSSVDDHSKNASLWWVMSTSLCQIRDTHFVEDNSY